MSLFNSYTYQLILTIALAMLSVYLLLEVFKLRNKNKFLNTVLKENNITYSWRGEQIEGYPEKEPYIEVTTMYDSYEIKEDLPKFYSWLIREQESFVTIGFKGCFVCLHRKDIVEVRVYGITRSMLDC